jgi:hypothetical protein
MFTPGENYRFFVPQHGKPHEKVYLRFEEYKDKQWGRMTFKESAEQEPFNLKIVEMLCMDTAIPQWEDASQYSLFDAGQYFTILSGFEDITGEWKFRPIMPEFPKGFMVKGESIDDKLFQTMENIKLEQKAPDNW